MVLRPEEQSMQADAVMKPSCNHVWRDTPMPEPKQTVEELFESVKNAGIHGWWMRG